MRALYFERLKREVGSFISPSSTFIRTEFMSLIVLNELLNAAYSDDYPAF
jgi:hypothetical protein